MVVCYRLQVMYLGSTLTVTIFVYFLIAQQIALSLGTFACNAKRNVRKLYHFVVTALWFYLMLSK